MEVVDNKILSSFLQLSNYFAENYGAETVSSPLELWRKHGKLIADLLSCSSNQFSSSKQFYEVLQKRFDSQLGTLATSLDFMKAANGDLMEICKFYTLLLEYMRKEQGDLLKKILEKLSSNAKFNNEALLKLFNHFDELYEDDDVDEWWMILRQNIDDKIGTDSPRLSMSSFATPKNSARRIRSVYSSVKRSPIIDAIDSPTMRFMRTERELKQVKSKLSETELKLEDAENENMSLIQENRELKMKMDTLRSDLSTDRDAVQRAEEDVEFIRSELDSRTNEVTILRQELDGAKQNIRGLLRQIELSDKEKCTANSTIDVLSKDKDNLMRQLRDIRETNEADFQKWKMKENELTMKLQEALEESSNSLISLETVKGLEESSRLEVDRLAKLLEASEFENSRLKQNVEQLTEDAQKIRETHLEAIRKERKDRENAVAAEIGRLEMANRTISRLNGELELARKEKDEVKALFDSLNEKSLQIGADNHDKEEETATIKSCLEAARDRIILLETEVKSKEALVESLESHLGHISELLAREQRLRISANEQNKVERSLLEKDWKMKESELTSKLEKVSSKLQSVQEKYEEIRDKYNSEIGEMKEVVSSQSMKIEELKTENSRLLRLYESEKKENQYFRARSHFENELTVTNNGSADSLNKSLSENNLPVKSDVFVRNESNRASIASETPRTSVAPSMDIDETMYRTPLPRGCKLQTEHRGSLSSINQVSAADETIMSGIFDRSSIQRSSINLESSLLTSTPSNFKQPYSPTTDNDRWNTLKQRNANLPPHMQSSYPAENVNSPAGNEENLKTDGTWKKPKNRRQSMSAGLSQIFSRKPK